MTRITPLVITSLEPQEIFVFGSNTQGRHGKGAALVAKQKFGAQQGVWYGITGQCFAIPTKDLKQGGLAVEEIKYYVDSFLKYVFNTPGKEFLVTPIGCGLAGHNVREIAPLFKNATSLWNIALPKVFWDILTLVDYDK